MKAFVDPDEANAFSKTSGPFTVTLTRAGSPTATILTSPVSKWIIVRCVLEMATSSGLVLSSVRPTRRTGVAA
jgi:hypothetical protein